MILAALLIATIGVQYYLNLLVQREYGDLRDAQARALASAFALGAFSLTGSDRIQDLLAQPAQPYLDEDSRERVRDIIIIDSRWQISDSLNPDYLPTGEAGNLVYKNLGEITDLPPLMEGKRLGEDLARFPNKRTVENKFVDDEAHVLPIDTTSDGRWYIMVLLRNDRRGAEARAAQPLLVTLAVLSISTLITFLLVFRFTRPIADLSDAARQLAEGDLTVRVSHAHRRDELGRLGLNFNEMAAELEKKRDLEAQLQQAEKSAVVGRLGSAIAHEIRNPLNYINLTLDHLRSKFAPTDSDKLKTFDKLTTQLKNEVARINQQISDFLNYSRPAKADLKPLDARKAIEDPLRIAEAEAEEKDVTIGIVEHENVPQILGDTEFLRSVFNNLFINAIQAMEADGGHLTIKILPDESGEFVDFEIADSGPGISPEHLNKIFEPYFSTKETGTGLGLAIVHKIVEMHNGRIDVNSTEGVGTTFTVKLPVAK